MIFNETRKSLRESMLFSLGASAGALAVDAIALGVNAIVLARNVVRAATALVYDAAYEIRGER